MFARVMFIAAMYFSTPGFAAQSKEAACALQNDVVSAIQKARLDRVRKAEVVPTLVEANPAWPTGLADGLPQLVEWVYSLRRRDLKGVDLGATAEQQCLDNWDQIQALTNN